jgi:uncharacterized protein (TIGR03435 family)
MTFLKVSCTTLALCLCSAYGQTAPAALAFEVASVKPAGALDPQKIMSGQMRIGKKVDKARVEYSTMALGELIAEAYKIKSFQLVGPDWMTGISAPRFDIQAKMPQGATEDQIPQMLQALLAERFGLKIHKDSKERSIYALVVAKTGLKMKPADAPPEGPDDSSQPGIKVTGNMQDGKGITVKGGQDGATTKVSMSPDNKSMHMEISKLPMDKLVELLGRLVDRPIVDMTELKGDYQVALDLSMSAMMAMAGAMNGAPPGAGDGNKMVEATDPGTSIFESVQKLGLKLDARKGPLENIVVDHLEKTPTEN